MKFTPYFSVRFLAGALMVLSGCHHDETDVITSTQVLAAWSQFIDNNGTGDTRIAGRFILDGAGRDCSDYSFQNVPDGATLSAVNRTNPNASDFPVSVCQATFPKEWFEINLLDKNNQRVKVQSTNEAPSKGPVQSEFSLQGPAFIGTQHKDEIRLLAIGDSGCSIVTYADTKRSDQSAKPCAPETWPLHEISKAASLEAPDLIVHVGDYRYWNEPGTASPASRDRWEGWKGDFFRPAQPLLIKAPWAFTRGNHENCNRGWYGDGFYYFLGHHETIVPNCGSGNRRDRNWTVNIPAKIDSSGQAIPEHNLLMIDTAPSSRRLKSEIKNNFNRAIAYSAGKSIWWVTHRPIVSLEYYNGGWKLDDYETLTRFSETLDGQNRDISSLCHAGTCYPSLMLFGHEHFYQYIKFSMPAPHTVITGNSGTYSHDATGLKQSPCSYNGFEKAFDGMSGTVDWSNAHGYMVWSRTHNSVKYQATGWNERPEFIQNVQLGTGSASPCASKYSD